MAKKKQQSIQQAYEELQDIVSQFENEDINLESSVEKFKRGLELSTYLQKKLNSIKTEVEEVKAKFNQDSEGDSPTHINADTDELEEENKLPF